MWRMGLLGWDCSWVSLCLTCCHLQHSMLGLMVSRGKEEHTPKPEPMATVMPLE